MHWDLRLAQVAGASKELLHRREAKRRPQLQLLVRGQRVFGFITQAAQRD